MSYKDTFKSSASSDSEKSTEKSQNKPDVVESPAPAKDPKKSKS